MRGVGIYLVVRSMFRAVAWTVRMSWRFWTGAHLDGKARTDATWTKPGLSPLDGRRQASWWAYRPRWTRAGIRSVVTVVVFGTLFGLVTHPRVTVVVWVLAVLGLLTLAGFKVYRRVRSWRHIRDHVRPVHRALAPTLGLGPNVQPESYITVPMTYATDEDTPVVITLPDDFVGPTDGRGPAVKAAVTERLNMPECDATWTRGKTPQLVVRIIPKPPSKLPFAQMREAIELAPESAPIVGMAARKKIVDLDLENDAPHYLLSAGTGGGKSAFIRAIAAQVLHNAGQVIFLDVKMLSHIWARGLPGVTYCHNVGEIHDAVVSAGEVVEKRYSHALGVMLDKMAESDDDDVPDDGSVDVGPRILLVAEEMNALIGKLQTYWTSIREKDDPKTSPAVDAFRNILFMGRQGRVHVGAVAQMGTARTLGGPEARENFAYRALTRATPQAWKILAPEIRPIPKKVSTPGRWHIVANGEATETQVVYFSNREARRWARGGDPLTVPVPLIPTQVTRDTAGDVSQEGRPHLTLVETRYTLSEAAQAAFLRDSRSGQPAKYDAIKRAMQRARKFHEEPASTVVKGRVTYAREDLVKWWENRPGVTKSESISTDGATPGTGTEG